jgi:molybdenum cofactor cytidylyltransferase
MSVSAIIIATERAQWANEPVALLPWDEGRTLIEYHIDQLRACGVRDIEVVLGDEADRVIPLLSFENVEPIVNGAWSDDPASSIRAGAAAVVRGTRSALVIDVREPRPAPILEALIHGHEQTQAQITVPAFEGTRGSPIVAGEQALAVLRNVRGDCDLPSVIERMGMITNDVTLDSDVVLLRINSRETYEGARSAFGVG